MKPRAWLLRPPAAQCDGVPVSERAGSLAALATAVLNLPERLIARVCQRSPLHLFAAARRAATIDFRGSPGCHVAASPLTIHCCLNEPPAFGPAAHFVEPSAAARLSPH